MAGVEGDLLVEQSRVALTEERFADARALAREALQRDPEAWAAWRLYLRACANAGLRDVAEAELRSIDDAGARVALAWWQVSHRDAEPASLDRLPDPRARIAKGWSLLARGRPAEALAVDMPADEPLAMRLRLRASAATGDLEGREALARGWMASHPSHPDVLAELWSRPEASPRIRRQVLRWIRHTVTDADARWLLLSLRTVVAAGDDELAEAIAQRLESLGVERPLPRSPWGGPMRRAMGRALAGYRELQLPEASEAELIDVAASISDRLVVHDRAEEAASLWADLRGRHDGWEAALGHARALKAAGDEPAAQQALDGALQATLAPWDHDPCGRRLDARRAAARRVVEASGGRLAEPDALQRAAAGDLAPWRALAADPGLSWCLAARAGDAEEGGGTLFLRPAVAAATLASAQPIAPQSAPEASAPRQPVRGDRFPDVPLPIEGGRISALSGVPTVITLWASWCQPCRQELPALEKGIAELRKRGEAVQWLVLSVDEHEAPYRRATQRLGLEQAVQGRDPGLLRSLAVGEVPTTWVVDAQGQVVLVRSGYDEDLVRRVLGEVTGRSP